MNNYEWHQKLSKYNQLNEQEQKIIQDLCAAGADYCTKYETTTMIKQALPLELTKIWGRNRDDISEYELENIYRFFERMVKDD